MMTPKKLKDLIHEFLYEKRKSDSGNYAEVTADDVNNLYKIITMLVQLKFEPDADGDYPVDWDVTDLTRYEGNYFLQVPRWLGRDDDNADEILRAYATNNSMAAESLHIFSNVVCQRLGRIKG